MKSIFEHLELALNEKSIAKFTKPVNIKVTVDKTFHAQERQTRVENETPISEQELISAAERAIEQITLYLMQNELDVNEPFIIRDLDTEIEIACVLESGINNCHITRITNGCSVIVLTYR